MSYRPETVEVSKHTLETLIDGAKRLPLTPYLERAVEEATQAALHQVPDTTLMREAAQRHVGRMLKVDGGQLKVVIYTNTQRNSSGLLEWTLAYEFETGGKLTVGLIQRAPGQPVEAHS